ncbi:MBL fold metallo-hydrolase [Pseudonocardia spinosispora]|uniref:MBL fold metallo-hydrolase n=1 Tax=Pseudonocardia spinosispora TaxID=103441 RepID=UPI00048CAC2C|nr:MBL fold metallo-hydrolase [Pseudonocardia spinosispora]
MRLTKFEHACVRLEHAGTTLVLDPGALSDAEVTRGADAILITHEHFDHFEPKTLRAAATANPDLAIWAPASVVAKLSDVEELTGRVHTAAHGDALSVGGVEVHVYGEWHAPTHLDPVSNVGYRIAGTVFHPGDAFTVPEDSVDTLLLPTTGPWLKSIEILEFAQKVGARQGFSIHDGIVNEIGLVVVDNILNATSTRTGVPFTRLPVGDSTDLT